MSNESPENTSPPTLVSADLKKMLIVPAMTLFVAGVVAWYAAQSSLTELRFQAQTNKENIGINAGNIKSQGEAINQIVISIARISENQARIASDVKDIQLQMREQLNRQK